jgi:hypothetical protein
VSIDSAVKELKSPAFTGKQASETAIQARRELVLFEKDYKTSKYQFALEMAFHVITERVIFRAFKIHDSYSIMFSPAYSIGERELIHQMEISRVLFNRISNSLFETFMKDNPAVRAMKIGQIINQIEASLRLDADVKTLFPVVDRTLFRKSLVVDGIGVDVLIERNLNCTGLNVEITPHKGIYSIDFIIEMQCGFKCLLYL